MKDCSCQNRLSNVREASPPDDALGRMGKKKGSLGESYLPASRNEETPVRASGDRSVRTKRKTIAGSFRVTRM